MFLIFKINFNLNLLCIFLISKFNYCPNNFYVIVVEIIIFKIIFIIIILSINHSYIIVKIIPVRHKIFWRDATECKWHWSEMAFLSLNLKLRKEKEGCRRKPPQIALTLIILQGGCRVAPVGKECQEGQCQERESEDTEARTSHCTCEGRGWSERMQREAGFIAACRERGRERVEGERKRGEERGREKDSYDFCILFKFIFHFKNWCPQKINTNFNVF